MAYIPSRNAANDGAMTYYADSVNDIPIGAEEHFHVGDTFICKADGTEGIVTYMLFPSGWWKVG